MDNTTFKIPLYRAKKIDTEEYVIGFLYSPTPSTFYILTQRSGSIGLGEEIIIEKNEYFEIIPKTLAISMEREDKVVVFEAINQHGVGGDIVEIREIDYLGRPQDGTEKRTAILNTSWDKFEDYDVVNDSEIIKIDGIKS